MISRQPRRIKFYEILISINKRGFSARRCGRRVMSTWLQNVTILVLICVPLALSRAVSHGFFMFGLHRQTQFRALKTLFVSSDNYLACSGDLGGFWRSKDSICFLTHIFFVLLCHSDFVWMRHNCFARKSFVAFRSGAAAERHEHRARISITICWNDAEKKTKIIYVGYQS